MGPVTEQGSTTVRLDQWLWAVRLFRTRSMSAAACRGGHVDVNGKPAKAASAVRPGDRVEVRIDHRVRIVEVVQPIGKRVGAPIAATCLVDHSPPAPDDPFDFVHRPPGAGRPTKRDRRRIDRLRGR
jgi:ribosome-associated heat shock protein Hsp15